MFDPDREYTFKTVESILYQTVSRNFILPYKVRFHGNVMLVNGKFVSVGGRISSFEVSERGIFLDNMNIIVPAGCGHFIKNINDLEGFCGVCHRVICSREGCLAVCEESGILVCRKDRVVTWDGRTVSRLEAGKPLSILKSLIRRKDKEQPKEISDEKRKLLR